MAIFGDILQGLPDYLRETTVEILQEDPDISGWLEGRIFQSAALMPLSMTAIPYAVVALATLDPDQRIGGVADTIDIATMYVFDVFREEIPVGEVSIGGPWDAHVLWLAQPQNARLYRPGKGQYVEHLEGFRPAIVEQLLEEDQNMVRVALEITATYRLNQKAREQFKFERDNPA
jgi:hypothetical protein